MKHYLSRFGSSLLALALVGAISLTALASVRPFHLVEHGQLSVTPRDQSGTVLDVVANGVGTATHLGAITVERKGFTKVGRACVCELFILDGIAVCN